MKTIKTFFKEIQKIFPDAKLEIETRSISYSSKLNAAEAKFGAKYGGYSPAELYGTASIQRKKNFEIPVLHINGETWLLKKNDGSVLVNKNLNKLFEAILKKYGKAANNE